SRARTRRPRARSPTSRRSCSRTPAAIAMADAAELRAALRRGFATSVRQLGLALELIAEDVLGEADEPIDWIAAGPDGRVWVVLLETGAGPAGMVERGL